MSGSHGGPFTFLIKMRRARVLMASLFRDDSGQDLIEYALLTTVIGLAGIVAFDLILQAVGGTYQSWGTGTNSLWEPPPPVGS